MHRDLALLAEEVILEWTLNTGVVVIFFGLVNLHLLILMATKNIAMLPVHGDGQISFASRLDRVSIKLSTADGTSLHFPFFGCLAVLGGFQLLVTVRRHLVICPFHKCVQWLVACGAMPCWSNKPYQKQNVKSVVICVNGQLQCEFN